MAEFIEGNKKPERLLSLPGQYFDALGRSVPDNRKETAYLVMKSMGVPDFQERMACVSGMAEQVSRDNPYGAIHIAMRYVDLTGAYRLLATLCTDPPV